MKRPKINEKEAGVGPLKKYLFNAMFQYVKIIHIFRHKVQHKMYKFGNGHLVRKFYQVSQSVGR